MPILLLFISVCQVKFQENFREIVYLFSLHFKELRSDRPLTKREWTRRIVAMKGMLGKKDVVRFFVGVCVLMTAFCGTALMLAGCVSQNRANPASIDQTRPTDPPVQSR
ncbi:MAG: hypothetical protein A4E65_03050 [Syntrophorhabdus sp. PtaU1.Bin153]|nr:MAG: hypothetical protein A4E65_03050 [Syntrophorhabdus sp. PtaU1.Bin153]